MFSGIFENKNIGMIIKNSLYAPGYLFSNALFVANKQSELESLI
jgi:hypothetical protein